MKRLIFFCVGMFLLGLTRPCNAGLVEYDFLGHPGNQVSQAASSSDPFLSALALTRGSGLNPRSASDSFSGSGWNGESTDYFSFGFSVASGYTADLSTISFSGRSSNKGPGNLILRSSVDGFSTTLGTITQSGTDVSNNSFDVSALTNLSGLIEFRIFAEGTNAADGTLTQDAGTFRLGNDTDVGRYLTINGSLQAVPEPTTMILVCTGAFAGIGLRESRRLCDLKQKRIRAETSGDMTS